MSTGALNLPIIFSLMMIATVRWQGTSCVNIKITQLDNQYQSVK